jgi:hypothetical protein
MKLSCFEALDTSALSAVSNLRLRTTLGILDARREIAAASASRTALDALGPLRVNTAVAAVQRDTLSVRPRTLLDAFAELESPPVAASEVFRPQLDALGSLRVRQPVPASAVFEQRSALSSAREQLGVFETLWGRRGRP